MSKVFPAPFKGFKSSTPSINIKKCGALHLACGAPWSLHAVETFYTPHFQVFRKNIFRKNVCGKTFKFRFSNLKGFRKKVSGSFILLFKFSTNVSGNFILNFFRKLESVVCRKFQPHGVSMVLRMQDVVLRTSVCCAPQWVWLIESCNRIEWA